MNFVKIIENNFKVNGEKIELTNHQRFYLEILQRYPKVVHNKTRQCGNSLMNVFYLLLTAITQRDKKIYIKSFNYKWTNELSKMIINYHNQLPRDLQSEINIQFNGLYFDNDSVIKIVNDIEYIDPDSLLYIDELNHCKNIKNTNDLYRTNELIVSLSGGNKYDIKTIDNKQYIEVEMVNSKPELKKSLSYQVWCDAKYGLTDTNPFITSWQDVPGRDEKWKEFNLNNISKDYFLKEFENTFI